MSLGAEMKSLVEDILAGRADRGQALAEIKKDTGHILDDAKKILKEFAKEGIERAQEVKKMGQEVKSFLKSAGEGRMNDFAAMMKTLRASIKDISHDVSKARKDARDMVSRCHQDRMSAQKEWASLSARKTEHKKRKSAEYIIN